MNVHKALTLEALETLRGDNLHRARNAFRNCTPAELAAEYGQSGKTRAEILADYEAHDAKVTAAIAWVTAAVDGPHDHPPT